MPQKLSALKKMKPLSFLPALAVMYMIFSFSSQTGNESGSLSFDISLCIVQTGNSVFGLDLEEEKMDEYARMIEHPVRKAAHMTEYFVLSLSVSLPFAVYGMRRGKLAFGTCTVCILFACTDEYHQSFVAGRGPSVRDVAIDSIGVLAAAAAVWGISRLIRQRRDRHEGVQGTER